MSLRGFEPGYRAMIFGAGGGLGAALTQALCADPQCAAVHAGSRRRDLETPHSKLRPFRFALEDEDSIAGSIRDALQDGPLHLVLVATGLLHAGNVQPEKSWRAISAANLQEAYLVNAVGPALIAKHAFAALAPQTRVVFGVLSARVGSITDNRLGGWHAYRASKAALNMLVRNFAIELAVKQPRAICVALHPGTVDTPLSAPFQANVKPGALFTPQQSAEHLLRVIDGLDVTRSGTLIAWDGSTIPF
jgi:NAD(P)-dependent dehydrogenase (short-subunit alcohol dehydrogenase family)